MDIDLERRRIFSMKSAAETLGTEIEVAPLEKPEEKAEDAEQQAPGVLFAQASKRPVHCAGALFFYLLQV